MANKTVVLCGKDDIRLVDIPERGLKEGEVCVSIRDCGICGSDTHMVRVVDGTQTIKMGHEASGRVIQLGKGVTSLKIGDRVALEPGDACNSCKNCYRGMHNTCLVELPYSQTGSETGYMTQVKNIKASYCHKVPRWSLSRDGSHRLPAKQYHKQISKLPDNMTDEEGAFMEPLAVAVHDCRRGGVEAGKSVLVLGAGTIGLLCMMTARAMGASNVCIADIMEDRLSLAKDLGASHTVLTVSREHDDVIKEVHDKMGEAPDVVLECTGAEWCLQLSILVVVPGGCVCVIGRGASHMTLPIGIANDRQISLINCWRYDRFCFPIAIDLVASGKVNVARLVTHRYSLDKVKDAFQTAVDRNPGVLKVMVKCGQD